MTFCAMRALVLHLFFRSETLRIGRPVIPIQRFETGVEYS
jgi:hypothetical protein